MELADISNFLGITNIKKEKPRATVAQTQTVSTTESLGEKITLYAWEAISRPQKTLDKKMVKTLIIIAVVISMIFILMQEFLLVVLIASIVFMSYIIRATPAENLKYELNTHGVSYAGILYYWYDLSRFFFKSTAGSEILCVDTKSGIPGRLYLTLNPGDREKVKEIAQKYINFLEVEPKTFVDKAYDSALDKISFEK